MRAAFVTVYDASDVSRMSGTGYNISRGLQSNGIELDFIGPLRNQMHPLNIVRHGMNRFILRNGDHPQRDPGFLKYYARQVEEKLALLRPDVVFGSGGLPLAYLDTDLPIVFWTDCTFANLMDYYAKYSNLSARTVRNGHEGERNLYRRCSRAIFASQWAADSAIHDYGLSSERAVVISRGANVPDERTEEDIIGLIDARPMDRCILHFVGVDWLRKGGDIAVEAARELIRRGIPTELRVVGVEPEIQGGVPDFVRPLGRISKGTPEGLRRFTGLMGEAHFLIVPTRAEAYGIVYLEASAFGVPSLGTRTGGVASAVQEGKSGVLFDLQARGAVYAQTIENLLRDKSAYRSLALSAFRDYRERTNWSTVARQVIGVIEAAIRDGPRRTPA